jgi:nucleoside-diphosphate-sugar epimerase
MRVVVTGATGNVGTAVVRALSGDSRVASVLGIARRLPQLELPKVEWVRADVRSDALTPLFEGADSVVHLAWRIQPSHRHRELWTTNVHGSSRVFEAAATAGAGSLIHGSSVGVYSPGPKHERVDESWPRNAVRTSFYGRHKAEAEWRLDAVEAANPHLRVVRIRPGLVFQRDAASGVRRLFAGPFLPTPLLRPGLIRIVPDIPGLRVQAVHADDLARAYVETAVRDVSGAFNVAADPALDAHTGFGAWQPHRTAAPRSGSCLDVGELAAAPAAEPAGLARPRARRAGDVVCTGPRRARLGAGYLRAGCAGRARRRYARGEGWPDASACR